MKRRALALALAAAVVTTALPGVSEAAVQSGQTGLHLGEHQFLRGEVRVFTYGTGDLQGFSDEASSVYNNSSEYWILFDDKSYVGGNNYCIRPGEYVYDLHQFKFGDKISSVGKAWPQSMGCTGWRTFF